MSQDIEQIEHAQRVQNTALNTKWRTIRDISFMVLTCLCILGGAHLIVFAGDWLTETRMHQIDKVRDNQIADWRD